MRETTMSCQEIIQDMLSGDSHKIWRASCCICSLSQNHDRIVELLPYLHQIAYSTKNIDLGGKLVSNSRFLKKAFEIMDFHMKNMGCPCCLLGEDFSPIDLVSDNYFVLMDTVYMNNSNYVDYYNVCCKCCGIIYKVEERDYHFTWWNWIAVDKDEHH